MCAACSHVFKVFFEHRQGQAILTHSESVTLISGKKKKDEAESTVSKSFPRRSLDWAGEEGDAQGKGNQAEA